MNDLIIRELDTLAKQEKQEGSVFKARAYAKVVTEIKNHPDPINTIEDLAGIKGIGAGIRTRIEEIMQSGKLAEAEAIRQDAKTNPKEIFQSVYGIGPKKAAELADMGLKTLEEVEEALKKTPKLLNAKQKIGLKYAKDLNERIPRAEMVEHEKVLMNALAKCCPDAHGTIVGSYRRGLPDSGDIDMLVRNADLSDVIKSLKASGYILESLAEGPKKFMGISTVGGGAKARRLDILVTPDEEYAFAILYFTGSAPFNIRMRAHALKMGYSLNEHGLTPPAPNARFETEEDIFKFLNMDYVDPASRR